MPTKTKTEPAPAPVAEPEPEQEQELVDEELEIPLSETARYEVQLGCTFTYRGLSHWPRVSLSDSMMAFPDANGDYEPEGQESLVYRVEQVAHARLDALIARMKRDIDERYEVDQAVRRAATPPADLPAHDNPGGVS